MRFPTLFYNVWEGNTFLSSFIWYKNHENILTISFFHVTPDSVSMNP